MKKIIKSIITVLIYFSLTHNGCWAYESNASGHLIQKTDGGTINWSSQKIEAKGVGNNNQSIFKQQIAAEVMARSNLLRIINGIQIDSERIVKDGILEGLISSEKLNGFLRFSRVTPPEKNEYGLIEVRAYIFIDESGRSVLLPQGILNNASITPLSDSDLEKDMIKYTGLIIDATGFKVKPAMVPGIYADGGNQILYSSKSIDIDHLIEFGICGYATSVDGALTIKDRIGNRPLIVKAQNVADNEIDIFLNQLDAQKILEAEDQSKILAQSRIMIVINTNEQE